MESELVTVVDTAYYVTSMLEVYAAAAFLILGFPLFMWRRYLKGRGAVYSFLFCIITQTCFLTNLVLLLGFFSILSRWTLLLGLAAEYYIVWWKTYGKYRPAAEPPEDGGHGIRRRLAAIRRGGRLLRHKWFDWLAWLKGWRRWPVWRWAKKNWFTIAVLTAAMIYNMLYLNHAILTTSHSYQAPDVSVHVSWVYNLVHGRLFSAGIYPFYMHCMIGTIHLLAGLNLVEVTLYYGTFQTLLLFLTTYCFAHRLFCSRYLALLPVILLSLLLNQYRYSVSLPQECGMFAVMCIGYFMLEFLHSEHRPFVIEGDHGVKRALRIKQYLFCRFFSVDLALLALSVALVIGYHFYTAIAAFFLVAGFALTYLPRLLHKECLVPLLTAGMLGVFIAVLPFAACLAKGVQFQGSMGWAMGIINSSVDDDSDAAEGDAAEEEKSSDMQEETVTAATSTWNEIFQYIVSEWKNSGNYNIEFCDNSAAFIFICILLSLIFLIAGFFVKSFREPAKGYIPICFYYIVLWIFRQASYFGIPELIETIRISVFITPFLMLICAMPFDILLRAAEHTVLKKAKKMVSVFAASASIFCFCWCVANGYVHDYLSTTWASRQYYNEERYAIKNIVKHFSPFSFTIVSPTADYYLVTDYGYHTELSQFVHMLDGGETEFTIPTEYVFFFVEKKVLQDETYGSAFVAPEYAEEKFQYTGMEKDYQNQRLIIESKAYCWAQEMLEIYPDEFTVYFEDDIYVAYLLHQNINYPLRLKNDYLESASLTENMENKE